MSKNRQLRALLSRSLACSLMRPACSSSIAQHMHKLQAWQHPVQAPAGSAGLHPASKHSTHPYPTEPCTLSAYTNGVLPA